MYMNNYELIEDIKKWDRSDIENLKSNLEEILKRTEEQRRFEARLNVLLEDLERWDKEDIKCLKLILEDLSKLLKLKEEKK